MHHVLNRNRDLHVMKGHMDRASNHLAADQCVQKIKGE